MFNVLLHIKWRHLVAINLIAAQAGFTVVLAQNSAENIVTQNPAITAAQLQNQTPAAATEQRSAEDAERLRINQLRAAADAVFDTAKQACYQKFAVNTCIAAAREKQRSEVANLKRQEIALNDADRQRRGAEQRRRTEAKTAPDAQAQAAAQTSSAVAAAAQRQDKLAGKAAVQQSAAQDAQVRSQNMQRKQADAAKAAAQRQSAASAKAAQSKARYEDRMKEAEEKRAKALAKKPSKPPAAGLPLPPTVPPAAP
jgi:colicin import membrane protein